MNEAIYFIDEWNVGAHTSFSSRIYPTIYEGIHNGMHTIQFFMGNPKNAWKRQQIEKEDIIYTQKLLRHFPMNVFSHYPYCANLAGAAKKGCLAWDGNSEIDNKLSVTMRAIEYELGILSNFNHKRSNHKRSGVVIHPGSYPDREKGHQAVAETLNKMNFPENSVLLLENCAGEGNKLCRNFEELQGIMKKLLPGKHQHVKICVDTAHIWGQGDYDLRKTTEIDRMFEDFDSKLGISKFYLLHLNDSKVPLGSKKDVHACLGQGYIWNESFDSLIHLLNKCKEYQIPMVLETHSLDMITLYQLQQYIG
jgi:deoxyribonuclease-4